MFDKISRNIINRVIERSLDSMIRFALFRLGDMSDAEDAVQDAVIRLIEHPPRNYYPKSIKVYLFRILVNICRDRLRTAPTIPLRYDNDDSFQVGADDDSESHNNILHLQKLLSQLSEKDADILWMRSVEDISFAEIARIMQTPQSTIKYRYQRGLDKLRELL